MASKNQNFAYCNWSTWPYKKNTDKFLGQIPGNPRLEEVQKIVLNSTAHILRRALSI